MMGHSYARMAVLLAAILAAAAVTAPAGVQGRPPGRGSKHGTKLRNSSAQYPACVTLAASGRHTQMQHAAPALLGPALTRGSRCSKDGGPSAAMRCGSACSAAIHRSGFSLVSARRRRGTLHLSHGHIRSPAEDRSCRLRSANGWSVTARSRASSAHSILCISRGFSSAAHQQLPHVGGGVKHHQSNPKETRRLLR